jgi:hypothetical protein
MIANVLQRAWEALVNPKIRLKADFPWGFGTMAKQYVIASLLYIVGSIVPVFAFVFVLAALAVLRPDLAAGLLGPAGQPNTAAIIIPVVLSFVCGFGLELWYIRRCFHKQGLSLRQSMGLNLDSLGGSWWAVIWRVLAAFGLALALEQVLQLLPLPEAHDPAAELAKSLSGWAFLAFAALAVIGAPLFEEFVYRGFLFNVCRTTFRKGRLGKLFRTERIADYAAMAVSAAFFAAGHLTLTGFPALFIMGMLLAALYRRSGTLICPMLLHALNNLFAVILIYVKFIA